MMADAKIPYQPETVTAPGETLADLLDERGMTRVELAQRNHGHILHAICGGVAAFYCANPSFKYQTKQVSLYGWTFVEMSYPGR